MRAEEAIGIRSSTMERIARTSSEQGLFSQATVTNRPGRRTVSSGARTNHSARNLTEQGAGCVGVDVSPKRAIKCVQELDPELDAHGFIGRKFFCNEKSSESSQGPRSRDNRYEVLPRW